MYSHYSQPTGYGHPTPVHHPYPQYPPQGLQPFHHIDPNAFRADYITQLAGLTVNSRPIIQGLSMTAQEYSRWAGIVAQCLEQHIRTVPVWMKLPAFYLLDAISKNVFNPYASHFTHFIAQLFLESYSQVDPTTRGKMEEMLLTWRTGSPNGTYLFGFPTQNAIERGVWPQAPPVKTNSNNFQPRPAAINKAQVLSEIDFVLGQKQRTLAVNPHDSDARDDMNVLSQLRQRVEQGLSQIELGQVMERLRSYTTNSVPAPVVAPALYPSLEPPFPPQNLPPFPPRHATVSSPTPPPVQPQPKLEPVAVLLPLAPVAPPTGQLFANLFETLRQSGAIPSSSGTPTGAGSSSMATSEDFTSVAADPDRDSKRAYRDQILSYKINLTSAGITRTKAQVVPILYDRLRSQCKQCALRFEDTPAGQTKMQDHLDMHFKQNRKANVNLGRGHSRSWFIGVDDWINDIANVKGKGRADGSRPLNTKDAAAAERRKVDAELRALHVVVPRGDEAKTVACPICKEVLPSEFLEDDEEWVWKNAVLKDERVYHATCHAEALANNTLTRLQTKNSSRSATPESRATPPPSSAPRIATPPHSVVVKTESPRTKPLLPPSPTARTASPGGLAALSLLLARTGAVDDRPKSVDDSLKRKIGDEGAELAPEADGTPPHKKVAVE